MSMLDCNELILILRKQELKRILISFLKLHLLLKTIQHTMHTNNLQINTDCKFYNMI